MHNAPPRSAAKPRRARSILAGIIGMCALAGLAIAWHVANDAPDITVPNPIMPSPNAFDNYITAGRGIVSTKLIDDSLAYKPKTPPTLEQQEAALKENAGVLQSLHEGFAYEFRNPPARSFSAIFPYFSNFRRVARLLAMESQVRSARGDWKGASESALDAIRMGEDIPRGGVVIAQIVGDACAATGQSALWKTIEHLDAAQSRAAAQRLHALMQRHFSYADTIREEKWTGQAGLKEVLRSVTLSSALKNGAGTTGTETSDMQRYRMAFYMVYGKKRILQNYTEIMDATIAQARQPYSVKHPPLPIPSDPITKEIAPEFESARCIEVRTEAQNAMLLIALYLHAYRLDHGHYPAALAELVPTYLSKIPEDPFALQGPFCYRLQGEKYLLYSIGPDGKDNGGIPIDDPKHASSTNPLSRHIVEKESLGDIVAGVNP